MVLGVVEMDSDLLLVFIMVVIGSIAFRVLVLMNKEWKIFGEISKSSVIIILMIAMALFCCITIVGSLLGWWNLID